VIITYFEESYDADKLQEFLASNPLPAFALFAPGKLEENGTETEDQH